MFDKTVDLDREIQKLYVIYFGRPADPIGLSFWKDIVSRKQDTNAALAGIKDSFVRSPEFTATFDNLTNVQQISKIYNNLFGHDPSVDEILYWRGRLDAGLPLNKMIDDISESRIGNDQGILNFKIDAAVTFTNELDTINEYVGYSGDAALTLAKTWLLNITNVKTYLTELHLPNLEATIKHVTEAVSPPYKGIPNKDITQQIDNFLTKSDQKLELGETSKIHSPITTSPVPGIKQPDTLYYSIDSKGVITFSGSLETTKAFSDRQKAAIIDEIFRDEPSSGVVYFKSDKDVFVFANNGAEDHLVKITGIANQFQGGHLNSDGSITVDVGQFGGWGGGSGGGQQCDRRLKTNMRLLSRFVYPFNIYSFNYIGDDRVFVGPMAQELLADERYCHVVSKNKYGFYQVDFRALGINHLASSDMMLAGKEALQKQIKSAA